MDNLTPQIRRDLQLRDTYSPRAGIPWDERLVGRPGIGGTRESLGGGPVGWPGYPATPWKDNK